MKEAASCNLLKSLTDIFVFVSISNSFIYLSIAVLLWSHPGLVLATMARGSGEEAIFLHTSPNLIELHESREKNIRL